MLGALSVVLFLVLETARLLSVPLEEPMVLTERVSVGHVVSDWELNE